MADYLTPVERKLLEKQEDFEEQFDVEVPEQDDDPDGPNPGAEPDEKDESESAYADDNGSPRGFFNGRGGDVDGGDVS